MSKYSKHTYAEHFVSLKLCPLSSNGNGELEKKYFYWEFYAKPSSFSKVYKILVIWDFTKNSPNVYILNEEVHKISKVKNIPHLYSKEKVQLCLYYPSYQEFSSSMSLCETIIPWTYLWISYYEEWLYSGEWKGGGEHPSPVMKKKISPLKKIQVQRKIKNIEKKKVEKTLIDKIYQRRKKLYEKMKNNF
ncbi:MAG: hypothetical protein QM493_12025 [Sulfurovum sp.]